MSSAAVVIGTFWVNNGLSIGLDKGIVYIFFLFVPKHILCILTGIAMLSWLEMIIEAVQKVSVYLRMLKKKIADNKWKG